MHHGRDQVRLLDLEPRQRVGRIREVARGLARGRRQPDSLRRGDGDRVSGDPEVEARVGPDGPTVVRRR